MGARLSAVTLDLSPAALIAGATDSLALLQQQRSVVRFGMIGKDLVGRSELRKIGIFSVVVGSLVRIGHFHNRLSCGPWNSMVWIWM